MKKPLISIVLSTYNDSRFIKTALDSILSQTFKEWELIAINDASTDDTGKILSEYSKKNKRIVYIKNKVNSGLTKNLNKGIKIAKGKFIARIDGDDIWIDNKKLEKQLGFLNSHNDYSLIGTYAVAVDDNMKKLYEICYPQTTNSIKKIMLRHGPFVHSSILVRKNNLLKVNMYDERYSFAQDYDLYLKLGRDSNLYNLPEFCVQYRINSSGISRTKYKRQMDTVIKIIKNYKNVYPNYIYGYFMWKIRKYYPVWFRGKISLNIKNLLFR